MGADHRNPNVDNTAARYLCKALTRVHPQQRRELVQALIRHAVEYLERSGPGLRSSPGELAAKPEQQEKAASPSTRPPGRSRVTGLDWSDSFKPRSPGVGAEEPSPNRSH